VFKVLKDRTRIPQIARKSTDKEKEIIELEEKIKNVTE